MITTRYTLTELIAIAMEAEGINDYNSIRAFDAINGNHNEIMNTNEIFIEVYNDENQE